MTDVIASDSVFSREELLMMRTLAELIVPADSKYAVPSAADDEIFAQILSAAQDNEAQIKAALESAAEMVATADVELAEATPLLQGQRELAPFVTIVLQNYYTDDRVMRSLGKEPRAPFPQGYEVEQGDWSLLAPVQARGKIWRDVED